MAKPEKLGPGKYRIRWFDENNRRKSRVLDSYAEAREYGALQENTVREIRLGLRPPPLPKRTFGDVCAYWMENDGPLKKSFDSDQSIIRKHFIPLFRDVPLEKFGTGPGREFHLRQNLSQFARRHLGGAAALLHRLGKFHSFSLPRKANGFQRAAMRNLKSRLAPLPPGPKATGKQPAFSRVKIVYIYKGNHSRH